jgi:hypothetical protein
MEVMTKLFTVKNTRTRFLISFGLFASVNSIGVLILNFYIPILGLPIIWAISMFVAFSAIELSGKIFYKITSLAIIFLLFIAIDVIVVQVLSILFAVEGTDIVQGQELRMIMVIISKFLFFISSRLFLFLRNKDLNKYNRGYWWVSGLISVISMIVMVAAGYVQINLSYHEDDFFIKLSITTLFIVNVAIYYLILIISRDSITINRNNLINQHNNMIISRYKEMEALEGRIKRIYHDFNNHLSYIEKYMEDKKYESLEEYIKTIKEESTYSADFLKTGNYAIDTILEFKLPLAKKRGIEVIVTGVVPKELNVEDYDLCCMLSNIIDNAIESCELLGEDEERLIKCNFSVYKQYLSIEIINPVRSYEKGFKTRKANKELHGIGLVSVKATVEKNDGFSYFGVDDGQFRSKIMLNL